MRKCRRQIFDNKDNAECSFTQRASCKCCIYFIDEAGAAVNVDFDVADFFDFTDSTAAKVSQDILS